LPFGPDVVTQNTKKKTQRRPITSTDRRRLENALSVILGLPVPLIERAQESITKFLAKVRGNNTTVCLPDSS